MSRAANQVREKFFQDFATTKTGTTFWAPEGNEPGCLPDLFLIDGAQQTSGAWMDAEMPVPEVDPVTPGQEPAEAVEQLREIFRNFFGNNEGIQEVAA